MATGYAQQENAPTDQPAAPIPRDQLDGLVAPIALYPDELLGQILVASTCPLEIVQLAQWMQQNSNLTGRALVEAVKKQNWDPSIQASVSFPDERKPARREPWANRQQQGNLGGQRQGNLGANRPGTSGQQPCNLARSDFSGTGDRVGNRQVQGSGSGNRGCPESDPEKNG